MVETSGLVEKIAQGRERLRRVQEALGLAIVGQDETIHRLLAALLAGGHVLLVGVPGLAKTLLVRTLAAALAWRFRRVQFTPDLMPSDILGSEVLHTDPATGARTFKFAPGPVFANLLLADEINRTPPRTQSALLEAMQERTVTAGGATHQLPSPFMVVATQNPIEQEGTYPLSEAQLDRFLFSLLVPYPNAGEEERIAALTSGPEPPPPPPVAEVAGMVGIAREVPSPPNVVAWAVALVRATRPEDPTAPPRVKEFLRWGAGPRASQHLLLAAKAEALLAGRFAPTRDDVRRVLKPVLRHRIVLRFNAVSEGIRADEVLDAVLEKAPRA